MNSRPEITLITQKIPDRISGLNELAFNLWWSWHPEARELFKVLDRPLWKSTCHNPVKLLERIAPYRLVTAAQDINFLRQYDSIMKTFGSEISNSHSWYSVRYPDLKHKIIAYFSMEFAIHNSLPLYAGGLGVLAGDYCKEASDLGLPMIGMGFMYPQGYFQQRVSDDGWQQEIYSCLDFAESPIMPVLDKNRQTLKVKVNLDSRIVNVAVWRVNIGQLKLYLLDTDLSENCETDRKITARLYAGNSEIRLQQEILLGIGGVRVLREMNIEPAVWHANEGHSVFMMLERCRELVEQGIEFNQALRKVQADSIFTTHTPVPAGNDAFPHALIEKYFSRFWASLGLDRDDFMKLGTVDSNPDNFNMTVLGMRMTNHRNGVSQLHGAVCRRMWQCIWPDKPENEVPIVAITNGVHVPTWVSPQMARLFEQYISTNWLTEHDNPAIWEQIEDVPDNELWAARRWLKNKLISLIQDRARLRWSKDRSSPSQALAMGALLDPEVLTLGFSRRFTDYKRAGLVFNDPERLKRLLNNELWPIQILFAGKAHPVDDDGKRIIQRIYNIAKDPQFNGRIAFVEDYDMHLARYLVHGVDVWLNTPRPLQEASGTSGMKAAINGVPQLSVLDGWWYEAFNGTNGWALHGDTGNGHSGDPDKSDAEELYQTLEHAVIPLYYERDLRGVPHGWMKLVKQTIRSNVPLFSARRMVKEYAQQMYVKAASYAEVEERRPLLSGQRG